MSLTLIGPDWPQQLEIALKVLIATALGAVIGAEREAMNRPAGLRTHALLAAAAALLIGLTDALIERVAAASLPELLRADPVRVIEAIVTGVAFLGAGTIFRDRGDHIEGLTTAASLLLVAAIAITVAIDQLILAILATVLALVVLRGLELFKKGHK
jgi:putative Mg2+ transporter-C (MgtC) family protein